MTGRECEAMEGAAWTGFLRGPSFVIVRVLRVQALLRGLHVSQ
jgi:hypothetical protein